MQDGDSFYVHLPSNTYSGVEKNKLYNYVTTLEKPIKLESKWEVALTEINYTKSWYVVPEHTQVSLFRKDPKQRFAFATSGHQSGLRIHDKGYEVPAHVSDAEFMKHTGAKHFDSVLITKGNYNVSSLIDTINSQMHFIYHKNRFDHGFQEHERIYPPNLEIDKNGFVVQRLGTFPKEYPQGEKTPDESKVELDLILYNLTGDIGSILGWFWSDLHIFLAPSLMGMDKVWKTWSLCLPQPNGGRYCLFVYTDIIRSVHVGDSKANLLRYVEIPNGLTFGDQVSLRYILPEYKRLATSEISSIEIYIKDDVGTDIPFRFGRTIVTLHFRKIH